MSRARRARSALSSEEGSLLVEVLIGALVLAITTFAVLNGLDGAQATGRVNKERSVSSTLAQQDIERLRAYPIAALSNFTQSRTVSVAGVPYSVQSDTEWVRDASGVLNCTDDSAQADYLKISSTVRSPAQTTPVKEVSLLTPAAGTFNATAGTLVVKVTDRNAQILSGVPVSLSGTGNYSDTTNSEGCAIFGFIPAGDYDVDVPGRVSWGGDNSSSSQATVVAAKTTLKPLEVDTPASLRAHLMRPNSTAATWNDIQVANAKLPGGIRDYPVATPATAIDATGLFPFLDGYGVYAGTCAKNNPAFWDSNYFTTSGKGFVILNPGDFLKDVNVVMGELTVHVNNSSGANQSGARVTVRQGDSGTGCNQDLLMTPTTLTTAANGDAVAVIPMGTYRICVSTGSGNSSRLRQSGTSGQPAHPILKPPNSPNPPSSLTRTVSFQLPNSTGSTNCSTAADTSP
jgi:Tfp pilus assembly protein PilV